MTESGFRLGAWLTYNRTEHSRGLLAPDRARLLDDLGVTWDPAEAAWMSSYRELAAFAEWYGHFEVSPGAPPEPASASSLVPSNGLFARAWSVIVQ